LKNHLGHFVVALAEAVVADLPLGVDEVEGRPVVVAEGGPDGVVVVDRDRVGDPQILDGSADVVEVVLESVSPSGARRSGAVNLDHGLGEGLGCFLHQIVTDARPLAPLRLAQ
jgi:hypothetical protein